MLLDLCLGCINIVVGFYLDILEHLLIVLVIHGELIGEFLFTEFFTNNGLVLLFVISTLVSLMATTSSLSGFAILLFKLGLLHSMVSPAINLLLAVFSFMLRQVYLFGPIIKSIVFYNLFNDFSHVIFISQLFKKGCNPVKLSICHIIIPTDARDSILRLEHESDGRVINNNNIWHVSTQTSKILNKSIVIESTMLSIELIRTLFLWIQNIAKGSGVFGQTCSKHDHFI